MGMAISVPGYTVDELDGMPDDGNRYELLEGVLLVTPAPRHAHQLSAGRLFAQLSDAVVRTGEGHAVGPGAIRMLPATHLEPDMLVYPSRFGPEVAWENIDRHWLAVEVLSRSSRIYDREFKRDAYLAMAVAEVWLVGIETKSVEVCKNGESEIVSSVVRWRVPDIDRMVAIDLEAVFAGVA